MLARIVAAADEWAVIGVAMLTIGVAYGLFALSSHIAALLVLAFILGLGLGATQPIVMSLLHTTAPDDRSGEAVGIRTTIMNASQTSLPLAIGLLSRAAGGARIFLFFAVLVTGVGLVVTRGRWKN